MSGEPAALIVGAALVALGLVASRGWIGKLSNAIELMRRGHGCYAIGKNDLLLVDTAGNTIIVALDEIQELCVSEGEVRLRVASDLQGILYAILFDLFEEDGPGPSVERFFEELAPLLRDRGAEIIDDDAAEYA
jgi:hypothetical protein